MSKVIDSLRDGMEYFETLIETSADLDELRYAARKYLDYQDRVIEADKAEKLRRYELMKNKPINWATNAGKVLRYLVEHGSCTNLECAEDLGMLEHSQDASMNLLVLKGYARKSGKKVRQRDFLRVVWEITDKGEEWFEEREN
ncbi:hypothetical protein [Amycolatopsis sp.]|jgi:hypothetical protein|uniref:hypothetical protein n=1 Tax=Amycolatopsis sp. TaxID=37632 RepID=UPI002E00772F|nr:hypothetical protein [Amycolatopsis sp.]